MELTGHLRAPTTLAPGKAPPTYQTERTKPYNRLYIRTSQETRTQKYLLLDHVGMIF